MKIHAATNEPIELVIFDFDGTLIDSKYDIASSVNLTLEELGLPVRSTEEIFGFVGDGIKHLLRLSVGEENPSRYEEALAVFREHYLMHCLDTTQFYPGLERVFDKLNGCTKAIATNKSLEYTLRIVEGLGVQDWFAAIESPAGASDLKPEPAMLLRILQKLQIPAERAVLVGDSTNDVRAAKAVGMRACAVGYGYGNPEKVLALDPEYYCEIPEDILKMWLE